MSALLHFLGRTHPLVLHLPIGLVFASAALEIVALRARAPLPRTVVLPLAWLTAGTAVVSACSGWMLASFDGYDAESISWHRWGGVAVAATALAHALTRSVAPGVSRGLLFGACALLVPTGHLGATITHGADFLTEPFRSDAQPPPSQPSASTSTHSPPARQNVYAQRIAPILADRCTSCHGDQKRKGDLALHEPDAIGRGGSGGPVFVPGSPEQSELVRRLRLPVSDEDHMPPEGKPQLSDAEIAAIEAWIASGANFAPGS